MRTPPKIFIDDSHLKKPTRVQIKQGVIDRPQPPQAINRHAFPYGNNIHLEFKPLVEIDSTIVLSTNRQPFKNPRPGNYDLAKTASTEGIASKKSLELKKRYLLGEAGNGTGILKSGSASALDTRFKSFHSNISECQKLLNNHPTLEQPLSPKLPPLIIGSQLTASTTTSGPNKELEDKHRSEEKENVYNGNNNNNNAVVAKKNSLNEIIDVQNMKKSLDYLDTVNTALVENKLKEILTSTDASASQKPIKTIDLVTPEKEKPDEKSIKIIDLTQVDLPETMVSQNQDFIKNMEISETPPPTPNTPLNFDIKSRFRSNFIDLTADSPITDRSLVETRVNFAMTATTEQLNGKEVISTPPDILSNINLKNLENQQRIQEANSLDVRVSDDEERSRSPAQDTSIVVPTMVPRKPTEDEEGENLSDSLSSSTTSSVGDIPHFILDSTTSPETQNGTTSVMCAAPTIEFHDHNGELMQMDSLQLIEDAVEPEEKTLTPTPVEAPLDKATKNEINKSSSYKVSPISQPTRPRYEYNYQKHELKFDTKNQQKGETMKHLPFVQEPEPEPATKLEKPTVLNLPKTNQPLIVQPELGTPQSHHKDDDKTPMNPVAPEIVSDSETEFTGQVLTETELSDWTADDAVSENFVDMEFVLNSNKGTIKRNKKSKRKTTMNGAAKHKLQPPGAQTCGILKNLDIDEIEFMDTGSENESVALGGALQATNKPVLKNHGYVEFVETNGFSRMAPPPRNLPIQVAYTDQIVEAVNKEVAGVDYIEQGNCILEASHDDPSLKTPMNEPIARSPFKFDLQTTTTNKFHATAGGQQADSLNDIEDDSLMMISSQGTMTTTEESDALTVVTSPLDSLPPTKGSLKTSSTTISSTPTTTTPTDHNQSKSMSSSPRKASGSGATPNNTSVEKEVRRSSDKRKDSLKNVEDIGYEEYVKRLQQKIAQISNSPRIPSEVVDSTKKARRKGSKGDLLANEQPPAPTTPQNGESNRSMSFYEDAKLAAPPNLNKKLEEITKERVKQKDIIHDLVMDKLQTKKLLNAEKRLNRTKNRNLFNTSGGAAPSSQFSPNAKTVVEPKTYTPPLPPPKTGDKPPSPLHKILRSNTTLATPVIAGRTYKERPLSDNLEMAVPPTSNLSKTQSFSVYSNMMSHKDMTPRYNPLPPAARSAMNTPGLAGSALTMTEKLREEARARAKLLSNRDLGISPEEKLQQLRKKYQQQMSQELYGGLGEGDRSPMPQQRPYVPTQISPSLDEIKYREKKMMSSKSVNDIAKAAASMSAGSSVHMAHNIGSNDALNLNAIRNVQRNPDFTSDPNLSSAGGAVVDGVQMRRKNQTPSTPERRKSIIRTVSDFFTIRKRDHSKDSGATGSKENGNVGGAKHESVFGMFSRISPKSKEKSKDKEHSPMYEKSQSVTCLKQKQLPPTQNQQTIQSDSSSPPSNQPIVSDEEEVPPVPPLPLNYQRSDDESYPASESKNELKKLRAITKASKQAELKRLRIAQEIQREQEEIEVQIKELEERGVAIEKALRGEGQNLERTFDEGVVSMGAQDESLLKELIEILRTISQCKQRDEELGIRQQELQLEHRHAQLKEELNLRLSCNKLDKSSSDVAAEGAILNEMLEIVSKRAALRPSTENLYSDI